MNNQRGSTSPKNLWKVYSFYTEDLLVVLASQYCWKLDRADLTKKVVLDLWKKEKFTIVGKAGLEKICTTLDN